MTPRVSIGLPVYNGEDYVGHAIRSVMAQSYSNWELIISDNASTDGTQAICEHFAARDARIHYHRAATNRGAAWNFNRTFELSSAEYFRWLSHDDVIMPTAIQKCVSILDNCPEVVCCATRTGAMNESGYRILDATAFDTDLACQGLNLWSESRRVKLSAASSAAERFRGILLYSRRCYEIYGLIRRNIMAQTQLHPTYCGGEKVLLAEIALAGPIYEVSELLFYVRWHGRRFTANNSAREQAAHMATKVRRGFALPHQYRATLGYLQLVAKPDLGFAQRVACLWVFLRFVLQLSKWSSIIRNTFSGRATAAQIEGPTKLGAHVLPSHDQVEVDPVSAATQGKRSHQMLMGDF